MELGTTRKASQSPVMAPREAGGSGGGLELLMSRCARVDAIWLMTCSLAGGAVVAEVAFEMTKGESRLCVKPTSQAATDRVSEICRAGEGVREMLSRLCWEKVKMCARALSATVPELARLGKTLTQGLAGSAVANVSYRRCARECHVNA